MSASCCACYTPTAIGVRLTMRSWIKDKWASLLSAAVMIAVAVMAFATFRDYGISWDEELHVPYGRKLIAYYMSGFADRSAFEFINLYLYGGFFDMVATALHAVLPFGEYETRHLWGSVVFVAGLGGGFLLTRRLA